MKVTPSVKWLSGVFLVLVAVAIALYSWLAPGVAFHMARYGHMIQLRHAMHRFRDMHSRLPHSLEEVVGSGLLPLRGTIYYNPLLHWSLVSRELHYTNCEYSITFETNGVTICMLKCPTRPPSWHPSMTDNVCITTLEQRVMVR